MSYCVHCGVKLASYETRCPLCGTEVIDPNGNQETDLERFIDNLDNTHDRNINRHFLTMLITTLAMIPAIITIVVDLCINHSLSWSLMVVGAEVCLWFYIVFPFRYSLKPYWYGLIDTLVTLLYVYMISLITGGNWYFPLAMPLIILTALFTASIIVAINKKKAGKIMIFGAVLVNISLYIWGINLIINHVVTGKLSVSWAWWATVPLFTFGLFFILVSRSHRLSEWIRKKLFF